MLIGWVHREGGGCGGVKGARGPHRWKNAVLFYTHCCLTDVEHRKEIYHSLLAGLMRSQFRVDALG